MGVHDGDLMVGFPGEITHEPRHLEQLAHFHAPVCGVQHGVQPILFFSLRAMLSGSKSKKSGDDEAHTECYDDAGGNGCSRSNKALLYRSKETELFLEAFTIHLLFTCTQ